MTPPFASLFHQLIAPMMHLSFPDPCSSNIIEGIATELLESIFLYLPFYAILRCLQVSTRFRAVIMGSPKLQRRLAQKQINPAFATAFELTQSGWKFSGSPNDIKRWGHQLLGSEGLRMEVVYVTVFKYEDCITHRRTNSTTEIRPELNDMALAICRGTSGTFCEFFCEVPWEQQQDERAAQRLNNLKKVGELREDVDLRVWVLRSFYDTIHRPEGNIRIRRLIKRDNLLTSFINCSL